MHIKDKIKKETSFKKEENINWYTGGGVRRNHEFQTIMGYNETLS